MPLPHAPFARRRNGDTASVAGLPRMERPHCSRRFWSLFRRRIFFLRHFHLMFPRFFHALELRFIRDSPYCADPRKARGALYAYLRRGFAG